MNHEAGNEPRETALPIAVGTTSSASAISLRPIEAASFFAADLSMRGRKPQFVDQCNTTIGGLRENTQDAIQSRMANLDNQYFDIGARLTAIRTAFSDLNQKEFAVKNGFTPSQYNNWESGLRRIPVDSSELLCHRYGLTLDWIYLGRRDGLSEKASKVL